MVRDVVGAIGAINPLECLSRRLIWAVLVNNAHDRRDRDADGDDGGKSEARVGVDSTRDGIGVVRQILMARMCAVVVSNASSRCDRYRIQEEGDERGAWRGMCEHLMTKEYANDVLTTVSVRGGRMLEDEVDGRGRGKHNTSKVVLRGAIGVIGVFDPLEHLPRCLW